MALPYSESKAGSSREAEIRATLKSAGATAIGFMVDDEEGTITCQFKMRGRVVTVPIQINAYAEAYKRKIPRGPRTTLAEFSLKAHKQAQVAVWAVMADYVKAMSAMIECGFMDLETAFLPHIHAANGRRVIENITAQNLLPPPESTNQ